MADERPKPALKGPIARNAPPIPPDETARLEAVLNLNQQDAEQQPELIAIRDAAQRLLGVQSTVITNIEAEVMRILTARFLPEGLAAEGSALELEDFEIPRDETICQLTIMEPDYLVVPDMEQFIVRDSGGIFPEPFRALSEELGGYPTPWPEEDGSMGMRGSSFYAGAAIRSSEGRNLGTLCVMDQQPHPDFGEAEVKILQQLAGQVADYLERRALLESPPNKHLLEQLPITSEATEDVDVVVIGGGPGGSTAACKLAFRGLSVVLVEPKEHFGAPTGVDSKILREAAIRYGAECTWEDVERMRACIGSHEAERISALLKTYGVRRIQGYARIQELGEDGARGVHPVVVRIDNLAGEPLLLRAKSTVIATGSASRHLAGLPFDGVQVFDADTIGNIGRKPASLLIQGGGLIAVEYATIFATLGVPVTMAVQQLPGETLCRLDQTLASALLAQVEALGVQLRYATRVAKAELGVERVRVLLQTGEESWEQDFDAVLSAVGRVPVVHGIGLDALYGEDLPLGSGGATTDGRQRLPDLDAAVYAVGDVAEGPGLACHAVVQAQRAVNDLLPQLVQGRAFHLPEQPRGGHIPEPASVMWTLPEIAFVGQTEPAAVEKYGEGEIVSATTGFAETVRGSLAGLPEDWLVKLVCLSRDGRIVGVHLYGEGAAELIHFGAALVNHKTTVFELQYRTFPAVTLHEVYRVAANAVVECLVDLARRE